MERMHVHTPYIAPRVLDNDFYDFAESSGEHPCDRINALMCGSARQGREGGPVVFVEGYEVWFFGERFDPWTVVLCPDYRPVADDLVRADCDAAGYF